MNRKEFLFNLSRSILGSIIFVEADANSEKLKLKKYLAEIEYETNKYKTAVKNNDLFDGFKKLTDEQRLSDFQMYFPIYKAGNIQNDIPWFLLWIIHVQETAVSRAPDPEINGYRGGMQRHPRFYGDKTAVNAATGWEFLGLLPQRYLKSKGYKTNDYEEILFASKKINDDANKIKKNSLKLNWEQSILLAQSKYCAQQCADERVDRYFKIKKLLIPERNTHRNFEQ